MDQSVWEILRVSLINGAIGSVGAVGLLFIVALVRAWWS